MKKPLVIISACQFTRLALESLIPADRYIVRVYSNVTTEVEFVLKTSCGYLLADIPSLPSGELVLLACLVRLRSDAGQWQVCLTGDSDWFDNAPASSLYNGFPHIGTLLKASRYQNQIIRWLLRPLLPPTAARTDSLQCRGQNISTALGCRSGRHAVQPVQRAGVLTSVREGCVSFFSVPQELYLHSLKLYQPVLSAILPASEQKKSYAINCGTGRRVS